MTAIVPLTSELYVWTKRSKRIGKIKKTHTLSMTNKNKYYQLNSSNSFTRWKLFSKKCIHHCNVKTTSEKVYKMFTTHDIIIDDSVDDVFLIRRLNSVFVN